jgi:hypothetical protein
LIITELVSNMTTHTKETMSGGVVLGVLIGAFTIFFAAPLLFLLTHMG